MDMKDLLKQHSLLINKILLEEEDLQGKHKETIDSESDVLKEVRSWDNPLGNEIDPRRPAGELRYQALRRLTELSVGAQSGDATGFVEKD